MERLREDRVLVDNHHDREEDDDNVLGSVLVVAEVLVEFEVS